MSERAPAPDRPPRPPPVLPDGAHKGDAVSAAGRLTVETYTGKDGKPAATVVMLVDRLVFLEPPTPRTVEPPATAPVPPMEERDIEVPF